MKKTEKLIQLYTDASDELLWQIRSLEDGPTKSRKDFILRQVKEILEKLRKESSELGTQIIEESYEDGSDEAIQLLIEQGVEEVNHSLKSAIHEQAVQEIIDEVFYRILEATDNMSKDVKDRVAKVVKQANERSLVQGISRRQATKQAIVELTDMGITGIVYKNGTVMPVEKYLANVIHYHQRKAHVDGAINRMIENDQDLVYVNHVGVTCQMCAKYQGRVYSISGNDKRFPKLDPRPPYHGHCVHNATPWVEEYRDESEIQEALKESNRPFTDNRTEQNIREYERIQKDKSKKNETRKQWIRYKARMPDLPDLKTFASQKARNTKKYQEWMLDYRKIGGEIRK
ncbi:phage minor capsid protein [Heyndrickxia oleronia]|uniref:phage minor capsid protein n=1 Tax=Heyndrickxia oleronia TaxID=38875 RepID=UPI001C0EFC4C|nr:phage minor capsid protein [Heyndrickxia oleronia]MBU5214947.1 phage minor capsid protein [Heyndrickxia oleronia]